MQQADPEPAGASSARGQAAAKPRLWMPATKDEPKVDLAPRSRRHIVQAAEQPPAPVHVAV